MSTVQIVWLKKAFRLSDHVALSSAARQGPVLPLYVVEPEYWSLPDTSYRQYCFLKGCVEEIAEDLAALGGQLVIAQGSVVDVLRKIQTEFGQLQLWSHQETGNYWTYQRDIAVRAWCEENDVQFHEPLQFGVWRGSKIDRDNWAKQWDALMAEPIATLPEEVSFASYASNIIALPKPEALGLEPDGISELQTPGRKAAIAILNSFLHVRGEKYRTDMSSPVTGESGRARLSPHLT